MLCALFVLLALADNSCKQTLDATVVALQQKNPVRAKSILESAPAECGQVSSFYELTGVTDNLNGDSARAEQDFERAVALLPQEPRLLAELGTIYLKNGKVNNAADVLSQALKLNPSNSDIGKYLIAAYVGLNRWQDVAEMFDKLGAGRKPGILDPPVMILWFARALIETKRLGQIDKLLSPTQPGMTSPVLFSLSQLFAEHGMYSQVVRFLRQIPARDADDAVSFNLGLAYSHLKRFDVARRFYFESLVS